MEKKQEEVDLSQLSTYNAYIKQIEKYPVLSKEEEKRLFECLTDEARAKIVKSNLRLVVSIACKFNLESKEDTLDLIFRGNSALISAVDRFDVSKGYAFSTYATRVIFSALVKEQSVIDKPYSLSTTAYDSIREYYRICNEYEEIYHEKPSYEYVANEMNTDIKSVVSYANYFKKSLCLNEPISEGESEEKEMFVPSFYAQPEENVLDKDLIYAVHKAVDTCGLSVKEKEIITRYFFGTKSIMFDEIANEWGVSKQRVSAQYKKALAKLGRSRYLKCYEYYVK